jgi:hypothetical protein
MTNDNEYDAPNPYSPAALRTAAAGPQAPETPEEFERRYIFTRLRVLSAEQETLDADADDVARALDRNRCLTLPKDLEPPADPYAAGVKALQEKSR